MRVSHSASPFTDAVWTCVNFQAWGHVKAKGMPACQDFVSISPDEKWNDQEEVALCDIRS